METITFSRNKSQFADEILALQSVCKKQNLQPKQLTANHSEKQFRFVLIEETNAAENADYPFGLHSVEKTQDDNDLQTAIQTACKHFGTFEANIKRVGEQEDETHFVFTKIRG